MKHLTFVLDREQGARARAIVVIVASAVALAGEFVAEVEKAGWVVTIPMVLTFLGRFTSVGDK